MKKVMKIAIIGQQCAGKTTVANQFASLYYRSRIIKIADPIYNTLGCLKQNKHRAFMQDFGDLAKKHFGKTVFTEIFTHNVIEKERLFETLFGNSVIICDDIRVSYEFDVAKELGFKTIFLQVSAAERKKRAEKLGLDFIENHNSETEVPDLISKADYLFAPGTIDDLLDLTIKAKKIFECYSDEI